MVPGIEMNDNLLALATVRTINDNDLCFSTGAAAKVL